MIALLLTVPYDTGLLPHWIIVASVVTNSIVSSQESCCMIVSYALGESRAPSNAAEREYERSERLLPTYCPPPIAARLKDESNLVIADRHDEASILFADMEGFTAQASDTTPEDLANSSIVCSPILIGWWSGMGLRRSRPRATHIWW